MLNISNDIKNAYKKNTKQIDKIILNNTEIIIDKVSLDDDCYYEGNVFGTAIGKLLEFEVDSQYELENQEFDYYTGILINNIINWIYLGKFLTIDVESNDTNKVNKISAMDYMIKGNIEYYSELAYSNKTVTLLQVLQESCALANIALGNNTIPNANFIVDSNQFESGTLIRQVWQAIAQITGTIAKIKNDNKLYFITPKNSDTVKETFELNNYEEIEAKRLTQPINTVVLDMSDVEGENVTLKDNTTISQNGENILRISDNPFAYTQEKRQALIQAIYDNVLGFEYTAFSAKVQMLPYLETLDKIKIKLSNGSYIYSFLFRFYYKSPAGLESTIEAPSITKTTVKYQNVASALEIARRTEIKVNKQEGTIILMSAQQDNLSNRVDDVETETEAKINMAKNEVSAVVTSNVTGEIMTLLNNGYLTAEQVNTLVEGNTEEIATIKNQLLQTITDSEMKIAITTALEGGISYLKNTLFTINENGMWIATSADEFNAQYNNKGMYLYSYEQMIAKFDVNGAVMNNLKVEGTLETPHSKKIVVSVSGEDRIYDFWID